MNSQEASVPYSRESLERLRKILEDYQVVPWIDPATNSMRVKKLAFYEAQQPSQEE